jgi:hypothetical protein
MKKEVDIWLEENEPKGMIYNGDFYYITKQKQEKYVANIVLTEPTTKLSANAKKHKTIAWHKELGVKYIGRKDGMRIVEQLHNELQNVVHETKRRAIIKRYYPYVAEDGLKRYSVIYASFNRENNNQTTTKLQSIIKRKYRKRKVQDAFGFSKTYQTWIKNNEVEKVKRAIQIVRLDYKPTSENIAKESNMKRARVNAVIDVLLKKGTIIKIKGLVPVYQIPYNPNEMFNVV